MKRLSIIFSAVLILLVCYSTVLAQSQKGMDNRTTKIEFVWTDPGLPVYCDGIEDVIAGSYNVQWIVIRKDGNPVKTHSVLSGEGKSLVTGEDFKVHEKDLAVPDFDVGILYAHINFKGNQGSHYIVRIILDLATGAFTDVKTICPGN